MVEKLRRPAVLESKTTEVLTGCGNLFVIVGSLGGKIVEIFATLGKAGGCSLCQNEALCRSISLGLRHGVPAREYIKGLMSIQCPRPSGFGQARVLSCPDAIAKVLRLTVEENGRGIVQGEYGEADNTEEV